MAPPELDPWGPQGGHPGCQHRELGAFKKEVAPGKGLDTAGASSRPGRFGSGSKGILLGRVWSRVSEGLTPHPRPGQELRLQLELSQAVATRLREQLSESQQELQASRRLLQEQAQEQGREREDLLRQLEMQSREAQHCRATSELLRR